MLLLIFHMTEFWKFIEDNAKVSPEKLRLKYHGKTMPFDIDLAITQIECRRRFAVKFAETLANNPHWIFPSLLAGEQATSDMAANFHTSLMDKGTQICDLTAGLGIDSTHFASKCRHVTAVEQDNMKYRILAENVVQSGFQNFEIICGDCRELIKSFEGQFDTIFIDPARRASDGSRVFCLSQCQPDITAMLSDIFRLSPRLIIKMSPMLDITHTLNELPGTTAIYSVGTPTECKETVADVRLSPPDHPVSISAVTLGNPDSTITFTADEEHDAGCTIASPGKLNDYRYLLEPYPAVMKAAPLKLLSQRYNIDKLHPNTHIYLSTTPVSNFPGNTFRIIDIITFESRNLKTIARKYPALQITTRNFLLTPEKLRAKLKTRDTGLLRLFAVTMHHDTPLMIITESPSPTP